MAGRRPKPTKLKLVTGNPGKRALNKKEPEPPPITKVEPPADITDEARLWWERYAPILIPIGLLTEADTLAFRLLCETTARYYAAKLLVERTGEVLRSDEGGMYTNPYVHSRNKAQDQMHKLMVEFGMTPSSRSRTTGSAAGGESGDEWAKLKLGM
jgi:P27 family predicted phage terminase small subunit